MGRRCPMCTGEIRIIRQDSYTLDALVFGILTKITVAPFNVNTCTQCGERFHGNLEHDQIDLEIERAKLKIIEGVERDAFAHRERRNSSRCDSGS